MANIKTLGILGGMGPQATVEVYQRLIHLTPAQKDQDHLPCHILSDPTIPDRTAAIAAGEYDAVTQKLLSGVATLAQAGCAGVVIPCNAAHFFLPMMAEKAPIPILSMVDAAADTLAQRGAKKVGILSTKGTAQTKLYHAALHARGMDAVSPSDAAQNEITALIYNEIKAGKKGDARHYTPAVNELLSQGCDHLLLACTELSVFPYSGGQVPVVDAMDAICQKALLFCGITPRENEGK